MTKYTIKDIGYRIGISMVFMPIMTMPTNNEILSTSSSFSNSTTSVILEKSNTNEDSIEIKKDKNDIISQDEKLRQERISKIRKYYTERSMPLADYAEEFVDAAERHGLDWNLLPAISVRETSGGKNMCYNNPFGWGSCKIKFSKPADAIETVARNLGGHNPKTASYYKGTDSAKKLYYYNGTIVQSYPSEVLKIMSRLEKVEL